MLLFDSKIEIKYYQSIRFLSKEKYLFAGIVILFDELAYFQSEFLMIKNSFMFIQK